MIVSETYMGRHVFGKWTSNPKRKLIVREVPAMRYRANLDRGPAGAQVEPACVQQPQGVFAPRLDQVRTLRPDLLRGHDESAAAGPLLPMQRAAVRSGLYGDNGKRCPTKN